MASLQTEVDSGAPGRAIWTTRSVGVERIARIAISCSITINVVASMGIFNAALVPAELSFLQQAIALLMWAILIYASAFVQPRLRLQVNPDLVALVAFYAFAILSVFWSSLSVAAIMKSAALAMTTFGAFCLVTRVDVDEIVRATALGLFILVAASAVCALAVPDIGIDHSWMHNGQWQGVYESKQTLGFVGAYLMFLACYQKMTGQGWLAFLAVFLLASTCVLASESRGAGAVALAACAMLVTSMWSIGCMRLYAVLPFVMCVLAGLLILYFYVTGYDAIHIGNASIDLTERTFIWHYA
ncbi:MAG: O-antigen ligase family protein, partial [Bradyrhizobium sp.]|nr:O-antigen ligase family protein [Bradyrhizobium sp.]